MSVTATCDVLVVGAGPAGSAAAALFAGEGHTVRLVDRATFPRFKACGDFLSPEGTRILRRLGVEEEVRKAGARRLRGLLVSAHGEPSLRADFERGQNEVGYALERERLDAILLSAAKKAGAEVHEGAAVEGVSADGAVRLRLAAGESATWRARLVVGAGGKRCPVARDLGVQRRPAGDGRIDLLAHWTGLDATRPYCEMHVFGPGYTGVAPSAPDRVNVNTVLPTSWLRARAAEGNGGGRHDSTGENGGQLRERLYERLLLASPAVRRAVKSGSRLRAPVPNCCPGPGPLSKPTTSAGWTPHCTAPAWQRMSSTAIDDWSRQSPELSPARRWPPGSSCAASPRPRMRASNGSSSS